MTTPTLHQLNAHLFAAVLGDAVTTIEAPAPGKRGKGKKADATVVPAPAARYNDEQVARLASVGVTADQLATMADAEVDAILATIEKTA